LSSLSSFNSNATTQWRQSFPTRRSSDLYQTGINNIGANLQNASFYQSRDTMLNPIFHQGLHHHWRHLNLICIFTDMNLRSKSFLKTDSLQCKIVPYGLHFISKRD